MDIGQRVLIVLVFLVLFLPLAYATNFLFSELARRWGVARFFSALSAYTFVSFIFYVWLFIRFRLAGLWIVGLVVIYLLLLGQTLLGLSRFRAEFREHNRNVLAGLRKK
ncbi:MAG TPA: hypothetical protein VIU29_03540 [Candidatus Deferrimicrobiaceae bacterium]